MIKSVGNLQVRTINSLINLLIDLYGFIPHVQYLYYTSLRPLLNSSCQCCIIFLNCSVVDLSVKYLHL